MIAILLLIIALSLYNIKAKQNGYFEDFLSREQTNSIKGFFILFVFIRHVLGYITKSGYLFESFFDKCVFKTDAAIAQLLVVMFLFYSGYGVMEAIKKKGNSYISSIPRHRFLPTLLNFDIAVILFLLMDIYLGIKLETKQILLSFIGWDSIGNSNWYIFVILICYLATFLAFKIKLEKQIVLLFIIIMIALFLMNKPEWWYNTILSYPAGLFFSSHKDKIISFWKKHYMINLLVMSIVIIILRILPNDTLGIKFNVLSICFALWTIQITMKIKMQNKILCWLGLNLFPLYIFQRIPMRFIYETDIHFVYSNPTLFIAISLAITIGTAFIYQYLQAKIKGMHN